MPGVCGAVEEEEDGAEERVGEGGRREEAEAGAQFSTLKNVTKTVTKKLTNY